MMRTKINNLAKTLQIMNKMHINKNCKKLSSSFFIINVLKPLSKITIPWHSIYVLMPSKVIMLLIMKFLIYCIKSIKKKHLNN